MGMTVLGSQGMLQDTSTRGIFLRGGLVLVLTYSALSKSHFSPERCYWERFVASVTTLYLDLNHPGSHAASEKKSCSEGLNFVGFFVFLWVAFFFFFFEAKL